jgi:hypothetical protein
MVTPPAVSRAKAQPPLRRMGKGKAKADLGVSGVSMAYEEAAAAMPKGVCAKTGGYSLLCFCCPMLAVESYHSLYISENGDSPILSCLGKRIIDLHSKFAARKAAGEPAIWEAQSTHPKIFHQDEELAAMIVQCENRASTLPYGPSAEEAPAWIRNMPLEEQIGEATLAPSAAPAPNVVKAASREVGEWQAAKGGRPGSAAAEDLTLHTMMQGGPVNLGWTTTNRFAPIASTDDVSTPSKVTDNA